MKKLNGSFQIGFMLLVLVLGGCGQKTDPTTSIEPTKTLTFILQPAATETAIPTQTATPTDPPILEADQAQAKILDYLSNNGDCQLPCLWGITPGITTSREAEEILKPLRNALLLDLWDSDTGRGMIDYEFYEENSILRIYYSYISSTNNVVSGILFTTKEEELRISAEGESYTYDIYESNYFTKQIHPYTLTGVLSELGKPAGVMIFTYSQEENRGYRHYGDFKILLFYPDAGVLAEYTTQMHVIDEMSKGCPTTVSIKMGLFPTGQPDLFSQNLLLSEWEGLWPMPEGDEFYWRRLEDVTDMSVEQFYETFREPTDICIETPTKYWSTGNE